MNRRARLFLVGTMVMLLMVLTVALAMAGGPADDGAPQGRIAFVSQRDGNFRVYVMNADGSDQRRVTVGQWDWSPSWSPDGLHIFFYSGHGEAQIFKLAANDVNPVPIPVTANPEYIDAEPACSPDGERIAFQSERDGNLEIYVKDLTSGMETRVTDDLADDGWPAWSPDGNSIVFTSDRGGNQDIFVVSYPRDLSDPAQEPQNLTDDPAIDISAAWSPDGTRIAFASTRDGNHELYTMDVQGGNVQRLTCNSRYDGAPAWSPDSKQLAFQTEEHGQRGIYVMDAVECPNGNERLLTMDLDYAPDWWGTTALSATIDIKPNTLNLKSKGRWVTTYIELPQGYDAADIDVGTVLLEDTLPAAPRPTAVGDYDQDGIPDLMVKFRRQPLIAYLKANGLTTWKVELTVTGYVDGVPFEGDDIIRVRKRWIPRVPRR